MDGDFASINPWSDKIPVAMLGNLSKICLSSASEPIPAVICERTPGAAERKDREAQPERKVRERREILGKEGVLCD